MTHEIPPKSNRWSTSDSAELYGIENWGSGYFSISPQGCVSVHPTKEPHLAFDMKQLIDRLRVRGIETPVLIRFADILKNRLAEIQNAFRTAIDEFSYNADYHCIYPIKVNQQRHVVEEVLQFGRPFQYGLEAGSKPELLAVIALSDSETPIVCNGFKDERYIETAILAQKMGRRIFIVVEKYAELELILRHSRQADVRPMIGVRVKLAAQGAGRWQGSGGHRSKFGLSVTEILRALATLKEEGMEDCLQLLHFHLGSQVTNIRQIKAALIEAARVYADLVQHGAGLRYLDVGGGLGVDYDGSQTNFESSVNYTLQEYANDVVFHVKCVCDDAKVSHPTLFSESGRAVMSYHSVLVFNVLGVSNLGMDDVPEKIADDAEQPLKDLMDTYRELSIRSLLESFHDAQDAMEMAMNLFSGGYLPLHQRSQAETIFWAICREIRRMASRLDSIPEELETLDVELSETYFCNFSVFQSLPDSWAIHQLFPVMPIHRLGEQPRHRGIVGDITCDSDGKIDRFIDQRDVKRALRLHDFTGEPYYLGVFLIGAYQEILGDMHNLFGETNAVHVSVGDSKEGELGQVTIDKVIMGAKVRDVLSYVQFDNASLAGRLQTSIEKAVLENRINDEQAGRLQEFYESGLDGYTYLEESHEE